MMYSAGPMGPAPDGYARRVWQTQDGLPENTVQAFAQTPDHYFWIGSGGGLARFDGVRFTVFDRDNTPSLHENGIFCLAVSRDGALWIGTDGGGLVRYRDRAFRSYQPSDGLTNGFIRSIYEDRQGTLWVGTDDGLFRLSSNRLIRVDGTLGIPSLAVHAIYEDREGRLWVGGSTVITIRNGAVREYSLGKDRSATRVKSILQTRDGAIWIGTVSGLLHLRDHSDTFEKIREVSSTVRALWEDRAGVLWVGSIGAGLLRYQDGRFIPVAAPGILPSGTVLSIFEDREQNMWIGLQTGLLRLSPTAMMTFSLPDTANADFSTVYPDRDGSLWVAGTHLYRIDPDRKHAQLNRELPEGIRVRNVFRDRSGSLWMGTEGYGLYRLEGESLVHYSKQSGLVNDFIRVILQGRDGSMWIGTDEGVSHWLDGKFTNYGIADGLCYFSIHALLEDTSGDLWIGTARGLSHFHNGRFVDDAVCKRLRDERIWTIAEDRDGGLWFGTRGAGLFRWRDGRLVSFNTSRGLANNTIYQLLEDSHGVFWMSGPNGISSVRRRDLDEAAGNAQAYPAVSIYGVSDGVEATLMHGGVQPSGCITPNGEIWFPSNRGPVRMVTSAPPPENLPEVVIEQVVVDGREKPFNRPLTVPSGEGRLQVAYSAIRLRSQERVRFRYKLENFDSEWTESSGRRLANYTNLPPGNYRFRVEAYTANQPQSTTEASFGIALQPHIYKTGWFLTGCCILAIASVVGAWRLRLRQVHGRYNAVLQERNRVAREMHDTVIQGCAGLSALLEAVAATPPTEAEVRAELLNYARSQMRVTVDEARRAVWNLRQNGSHSHALAPLLSEIVSQVSQASQISVRFDSAGPAHPLDPAMEHDVLMVAREAIHNAVRHSHAAEVRVQLQFQGDRILLKVSDDGIGFRPESVLASPGEHFGLMGMRERVQKLGGDFHVRSAPGEGTDISLLVPVNG